MSFFVHNLAVVALLTAVAGSASAGDNHVEDDAQERQEEGEDDSFDMQAVEMSKDFAVTAGTAVHRNGSLVWGLDIGSSFTWTYVELGRNIDASLAELAGDYEPVGVLTDRVRNSQGVFLDLKLSIPEVFNISGRVLSLPLYVTSYLGRLGGPAGYLGLSPSVIQVTGDSLVMFPTDDGAMGVLINENENSISRLCDSHIERVSSSGLTKEDKWDLPGSSVEFLGVESLNTTIRLDTRADYLEVPAEGWNMVIREIGYFGRVANGPRIAGITETHLVLEHCHSESRVNLPDHLIYRFNDVLIDLQKSDYIEFPSLLSAEQICLVKIRLQRDSAVLIAGIPLLRNSVVALGRDADTSEPYIDICNSRQRNEGDPQ